MLDLLDGNWPPSTAPGAVVCGVVSCAVRCGGVVLCPVRCVAMVWCGFLCGGVVWSAVVQFPVWWRSAVQCGVLLCWLLLSLYCLDCR